MTSPPLPPFEQLPVPAYLFRYEADDFVLVAVSAAVRALNPGIVGFFGRSMTGLYADQPETVEDSRTCMRERRTVTREMRLRRHDRTEANQRLRITYVYTPPDHMTIFTEDITPPEMSDAAFRESEARYRSLVASLPDGLLVRAADGRVLACNEAAVRLFGAASEAELAGRRSVLAPGFRFESETHEPIDEQALSLRALEHGQSGQAQVCVVVRDDGTRRFVRVAAQPILGSDGSVTGSVATFTDITEQRLLEEELRRSHRLESIGRLAGGIAHDFNNLLAAMMGSLELLEDVCPPIGHADLATVRHAATRARDLTRQLLAFARKQPVEFTLVELRAMVTTVERMLRRLVGSNVELVIEGSGPVYVRADASQLEQVLVNLVVNASEAMPAGGLLRVRIDTAPSATNDGEWALLEVSDSGVGMDAETQRKVFDPFFTTKTHGTGLGLASSYGIVKQHGGDILVESEVHRGTRFRVLLPRASAGGLERTSLPAPASSAARKGCAFVIDDEELVRSMTTRMLESLGYQVISAGSAREALDVSKAHSGPITVLLCDVTMPGRDGPSVAQELLRERPELKVLFVSGYAPEARQNLPPGSMYLQKPFRRAELDAKLEELLRSK